VGVTVSGGKLFEQQLQQAGPAATLGELSTPELLRRRKEREEREQIERLKGKSSFVRTHARLVAAGKQPQEQQHPSQPKGPTDKALCSNRARNAFARAPLRQARTNSAAAITAAEQTAAARSALQARAQPDGVSKEELKQVKPKNLYC
jgi:hypothetical protein